MAGSNAQTTALDPVIEVQTEIIKEPDEEFYASSYS